METAQVSFKQVVSRGCGLDVHKKVVVATIDGEGIKKQTREFDTVTSSLKELRDWLLESGITHVAMESTGVFWKPVYNVLEPAGLTVWIVNAAHVKYVTGQRWYNAMPRTKTGLSGFWRMPRSSCQAC